MTTKQTTEKKVTPRKASPVVAKADARRAVVLKGKNTAVKPIVHAANAVVKFFVFVEGARPVSGNRLQAHTQAALRFLGLTSEQPASKAAVLAVMGPRAIKHHSDIGNFADRGTEIALTSRGTKVFALREESIDKKLEAAFYNAIAKGKVDETYLIRATGLHAVSMSLR